MARPHINFRTWAALLLLGGLTVLFAALGNWQLNRAAQRDAIHADIQRAASLPTLTLDASVPAAQLVAWRPAQATGHWLHRYTVLIENRNHNGRPGYWVATPLQLDTQGNAAAVLVLRGWLPRESVVQQAPDGAPHISPALGHQLAQHNDPVVVTGQLFAHVPRVLELWTWSDKSRAGVPDTLDDTRSALPAVQNLPLADYQRATGLTLLPVVLAANGPEPGNTPPMVQQWPHPSSDSDTNRGYALQWFSFCAIAAGACLFIAWRAVRRTSSREATDDA